MSAVIRKSTLGKSCKMYQPRTISTDMLVPNGKYLVYGANGVIGRYSEYNHEESELLMTCRGATCGTINVSEPFSWINGNAMVIHPVDPELDFFFLKYQLESLDLSEVITGAAQPQITRQSLNTVPIIIPSLADQQRIVAELDLLSSIVEKKNAQLCTLGKLAESLFNESFGNLITNDRNWRTGSLKELIEDKRKILRAAKLYRPNDVIHYIDISSIDNIAHCMTSTTEFVFNEAPSRAQQVVHNGDILVSMVRPNLRNIASVCSIENNLVASSGFCVLRSHSTSGEFLKQLVLSDFFTDYLLTRVSGANYPAVREEDIKDCEIGIPPVELQQEFSNRIKALETQRLTIDSSLKTAKDLLASRMDKYFSA